MARTLAIGSLLGLLALALWVAYRQWVMVDVDMPGWAWVIIVLGVVVLLLVGCGLMALMFYSHRRHYDDDAHDIERDRNQRPR